MKPLPASKFFVVGGSLREDAISYVERPADRELLEATLAGEYCNVLTARQMGKSSLMVRTALRLSDRGVRTAIVDLSKIGVSEVTAQQWYLGLIKKITEELNLKWDVFDWWESHRELSPTQQFSDFLREVILEEIKESIVIFVDEIDFTLALGFTDDFFAAIRAAFNSRATDEAYRRLSFVLLGVARPTELIKDTTRTPYNIGRDIDITDFTLEEVEGVFLEELGGTYPEQGRETLGWVLGWTGGQPYLTQKLCASIAEHRNGKLSEAVIDELVKSLFFGDGARTESNLRSIRVRIRNIEKRFLRRMLAIYRQILEGRQIEAIERSIEQNELKLTGLVRSNPGGMLGVSNRIYEQVFNDAWVRENMPANPALPWVGVSAGLVILIAAIIGYLVYRNANQTAEAQASVYRENFKSASAEVRLTGLAGLFRLGGDYAQEAEQNFFALSPEEQLALFTQVAVANVQEDLLTVADNVYQFIPNTTEGNNLLRAIDNALSQANANGASGLETEITYWLDGREAADNGKPELAKSMYDNAWERSTDRGKENISILYDRAVVLSGMHEYDQAIKDLELTYQKSERMRDEVAALINKDTSLKDYFHNHRDQYPAFWASLGIPTYTPTSTVEPSVAATKIPPSETPTKIPTVTMTSAPTPGLANVPDKSGCVSSIPSGTNDARLTVINTSGYEVHLKLTNCDPSLDYYYYIVVPSGTSDNAVVKIETVIRGTYSKVTWACNGFVTSGTFYVDGNIRLAFTPCGFFYPPPGIDSIVIGGGGSAGPDQVRVVINNPTAYDAFVKLTGPSLTGAFYYLTIPSTLTIEPTTKIFTILKDTYDLELWNCNALLGTGKLQVQNNLTINIAPCESIALGTPVTRTPVGTSIPSASKTAVTPTP